MNVLASPTSPLLFFAIIGFMSSEYTVKPNSSRKTFPTAPVPLKMSNMIGFLFTLPCPLLIISEWFFVNFFTISAVSSGFVASILAMKSGPGLENFLARHDFVLPTPFAYA